METPASEWFIPKFRRNANSLACRYGAPVYLVGSALRKSEPRDFDVRIILPNYEIKRLFGVFDPAVCEEIEDYEPWEWKQGYDNLKQSRLLSHRMMENVDFQTQAEHEVVRYKEVTKIRLDNAPDSLFDAFWGSPL